jgi:hypothetical protein
MEATTSTKKVTDMNGIFIDFVGSNANQTSYIQFVFADLIVTRNGVDNYEQAPFLPPKLTRLGSNDWSHIYLDGPQGGYVETGGVGNKASDDHWMYDAPTPGVTIKKLWNGPVKAYKSQPNVDMIYLVEHFWTFFTFCSHAYVRMDWDVWASWNRDQGDPTKVSVGNAISWEGAKHWPYFLAKPPGVFNTLRQLAGPDNLKP